MSKVRAFWDERASLGSEAGTQDVWASRMEARQILDYVEPGMHVLDVGCGTGDMIRQVVDQHDSVIGTGIDFSEAMIATARQAHVGIDFRVMDVLETWPRLGQFDFVFTKRCLINLPTWEAQAETIARLLTLLRPGGVLLCVECSAVGWRVLNSFRQRVGLDPIVMPWHNCYLEDDRVNVLPVEASLEAAGIDFSSTYYFQTRIVHAVEADRAGTVPRYDDPRNEIAAELPVIGQCGQVRYWRWRT